MSDQLPQTVEPIGDLNPEIGGRGLPPSLQILLNEGLYNRIKQLSGVMSKARGMTPVHLIDKAEACFAIINMSLDWKLSPHFVARHTYQTPGGQIGFDGALVQAVLEQSGRFVGAPSFEYRGDWETLTGKFEVKAGARGGSFAVPTWTSKDATGLGVIVRWQVKGESTPRVWPGENSPFWLTQCYPLNSPLWATDPKTQIMYLTIRRFANLTSPGILGAAAFDEDELLDASERAVNVTPPRREDFVPAAATTTDADERPEFPVWDNDAVEHFLRSGEAAAEALGEVFREAARSNLARLDSAWENNQAVIEQLARDGSPDQAVETTQLYEHLRKELTSRPASAAAAERPGADTTEGVSTRGDEHAAPSGEQVGRPSESEGDRRATAEGEGAAVAGGALPPSAAGEPHRSPQASAAPATASGPAKPEPPHSAAAPAPATASGEVRPFPGDLPSKAAEPAAAVEEREASYLITVPLRNGKPDYRTWAVALFMPKVRQMKEGDRLAFLIGDNDDHLTEARKVLSSDDRRQLDTTIEEAQRAAVWIPT